MSIIRAAIRLAAVAALRDRTWAKGNIYDSDGTPLVQALKDLPPSPVGAATRIPYIVVYTDTDHHIDISGMDIYSSDRQLGLVLEIAVSSGLRDGALFLPHTDAAMELIIDMVETQSIAALFGDVRNPWNDVMKGLINSVARVPTMRGGRANAGIRFAARQCVFVCDTIADTPPGIPLGQYHTLNAFLAQAQALPEHDAVRDAASIIQSVLTAENGTPYSSWEQDQAWLGLARRGIEVIGYAPLREADGGLHASDLPDGVPITRPPPSREAPGLVRINIDQTDDAHALFPVDAE